MNENKSNDETTPDDLMSHFKGRSLSSIIFFTIVVHALLVLGTSAPSLWNSMAKEDPKELTEKERMDVAVREATAKLREIAKEYNVTPRQLSDPFADGKPATPEVTQPATPSTPSGPVDPSGNPDEDPADPKSTIEKEIDEKKEGPKLPTIEEEEEDLFK